MECLQGWTPATILDGGGNIGMASVVFAFLYPDADIITIEPVKENCLLAKYNTAKFSFVRVQCNGLWNTETTVSLEHWNNDQNSWAWKVVESPAETPDSSKTATIQSLLKQHRMMGFDYAKLDIEGAEYAVLGDNADTTWLKNTSLVSIEIHGDHAPIDAVMTQYGMIGSQVGEYVFYARPKLHALRSRHKVKAIYIQNTVNVQCTALKRRGSVSQTFSHFTGWSSHTKTSFRRPLRHSLKGNLCLCG